MAGRLLRAARQRPTTQPKRRPRGACRVCLTPGTKRKVITSRDGKKTVTARVCRACGHVALPKSFHDYTTSTAPTDLGLAPRVGTPEQPGREFGMAKLAVRILRRDGLEVLIYGAGRSIDNTHIERRLKRVKRVAVGDIMRIRDDADFVDISKPAERTWDIVIASEVIEHFLNPRKEFPRLFGYVSDDGLLVCSTNVYDGSRLRRHNYIFGRGHTSYYSPRSLRILARENGMHVDFRVPKSAVGQAGPRKRYVLFSRSDAVMDAVGDYFGRNMYAPSERVTPKRRRQATRGGAPG